MHKPIFLREQLDTHLSQELQTSDPTAWETLCTHNPSGILTRLVPRGQNQELCYRIDLNRKQVQTSYFIGVDWLVERQLPLLVHSKLDEAGRKIDYLKMFTDALGQPENTQHLADLIHIDFERPYIELEQRQDLLSPFLIAQFLHVLQRIVRKGLKQSYYSVEENLHAKIKGKILIHENLRKNVLKGTLSRHFCRYQEYGVDIPENRLLKKALRFAARYIDGVSEDAFDTSALKRIIRQVTPAFAAVSETIDTNSIKHLKVSPIYADYGPAVRYARLILKRFAYNISHTGRTRIATPPFWIDMSKLFELYVYKKLREVFSGPEVIYHFRAQHRELDFLLHPHPDRGHSPLVIDAKYKPYYRDHSIQISDIRQVAGYARLKRVYEQLHLHDHSKQIDCLIIYANQECPDDLSAMQHGIDSLTPEKGYVGIYKIGLRLPEQ